MGLFSKKTDNEPRGRVRPAMKRSSFSYYQNRPDDDALAQERPKRSKRNLLYRLPGIVALIAIAGCLLYSLTLTATPKVVIVNEEEQAVQAFLRENSTYQNIASEVLQSSFLSNNKLTINAAKVSQQIHEKIPESTDVSVTLPLVGRNPVIYVRIAEPVLVLQTEGESAFVIDEQGRAVVAESEMTNADQLDLLTVSDQSGLTIEQGNTVLPADQITFIKDVEFQLRSAQAPISRMVLPPRPYELLVYPKGTKYYVKYSTREDAREQAGRQLALQQYFKERGSKPSRYIDVRVPNRAYVQ